MSFFKPRVSFPLNFALPFSVMIIIPLKFSSWNIICFWQKGPINVQFFRLLSALMKIQPIPHAIFETTRSEFIQNLHHWLVSWKLTPLFFFKLKPYILWTKRAYRSEIFTLLSGLVNRNSCHIWNHKSVSL